MKQVAEAYTADTDLRKFAFLEVVNPDTRKIRIRGKD